MPSHRLWRPLRLFFPSNLHGLPSHCPGLPLGNRLSRFSTRHFTNIPLNRIYGDIIYAPKTNSSIYTRWRFHAEVVTCRSGTNSPHGPPNLCTVRSRSGTLAACQASFWLGLALSSIPPRTNLYTKPSFFVKFCTFRNCIGGVAFASFFNSLPFSTPIITRSKCNASAHLSTCQSSKLLYAIWLRLTILRPQTDLTEGSHNSCATFCIGCRWSNQLACHLAGGHTSNIQVLLL